MSAHLALFTDLEALAFEEEYIISALAKRTCYSKRQFYRLIVDEMKCTPTEWRDRLRIDKAINLMVPGAQIKDIAFQLFYAKPGHFSRSFSRLKGVSPSVFMGRLISEQKCGKVSEQDKNGRLG